MMLGKVKVIHFFYLFFLYALLTLLFDIGFQTPLGSLHVPKPGRYKIYYWIQNWTILLTLVLALGLVNSQKVGAYCSRLKRALSGKYAGIFLFISLILLSLSVHFFFLLQMYLTDDESAYRFTAQLLARGQLTADSFPHKEFFDRIFMINDGKFFSQYYYGWPLLLALGELAGVPFLLNSLFYAGGTFLLFSLIKSFTSEKWAYIGALFFAFSPLMLIGSATYLSHSSATFFLLVFLNGYRQLTTGNMKYASIILPLIALCGGIVFLIRPLTGVLACIPFIFAIAIKSLKQKWNRIGLVSFLSVGVLIASFFFYINYSLHGSILGSGYAHYVSYAQENDFRFSYWNPSPYPVNNYTPKLIKFDKIEPVIATFFASFTRVAFDGIMVPSVLIFCFAIIAGFKVGIEYLLSYLLIAVGYSVWASLGIDSYGPVKMSEVVPLGILFVIVFFYRSNNALNRFFLERKIKTNIGGASIAFAIVICSILCYLPIRLHNVYIMANSISIPYKVAQKKNIHNAVVFCSSPFTRKTTVQHYRFWRDNPSIDLSDDIIWVNDFHSKEKNNELRQLFPDRTFYRMYWGKNNERLYLNLSKF